jgi:hypothetical protein
MPDLVGRFPVGEGAGAGLENIPRGSRGGFPDVRGFIFE